MEYQSAGKVAAYAGTSWYVEPLLVESRGTP